MFLGLGTLIDKIALNYGLALVPYAVTVFAVLHSAACTHVTEKVDEGIDAGVAHGQPVKDEPHDVDVLEAGRNYSGIVALERAILFFF